MKKSKKKERNKKSSLKRLLKVKMKREYQALEHPLSCMRRLEVGKKRKGKPHLLRLVNVEADPKTWV